MKNRENFDDKRSEEDNINDIQNTDKLEITPEDQKDDSEDYEPIALQVNQASNKETQENDQVILDYNISTEENKNGKDENLETNKNIPEDQNFIEDPYQLALNNLKNLSRLSSNDSEEGYAVRLKMDYSEEIEDFDICAKPKLFIQPKI